MRNSNTKKKLIFISILFLFASTGSKAAKITWTYKTRGAVYSSPTYYNGNLYIGSDDNNLYCLNATNGQVKWSFPTHGIVRCKPAIANGTVYFASDDGNLYALKAQSGTKLWSYNIGNKIKRILPNTIFRGNYWDYMQSSPYINQDAVFVGSGDSCLYAIDSKTGKLLWKFHTGGIIRSSPTVYNGQVYFGSWDGFIYALKANEGTFVWKYDTRGKYYKNVQPSPQIANGILYCGSRNPYFYALNAETGKEIWKYSYDFSWVESSATIKKGVVYVGSSDLKKVFAFDANTGKAIWQLPVDGTAWSTPFYDQGNIYIGLASYKNDKSAMEGGGLLAIDAETGKQKWEIKCGKTSAIGGVVSSPVVHDGMIYYGSLDGKVYAVGIHQ